MKRNAEHIRTAVIEILSDGEFHSGSAIGERLGLSRSAVANHIKAIMSLGIDVFSIKGRGYKAVNPITMLNKAHILKLSRYLEPSKLDVENVIESTNDYLKQRLPDIPQGFCCTAEAQTKGRGRRGRKWVSPYGASVYLSMGWRFSGGYQSMAGLSLLVGLAINRSLKQFSVNNAQLKWPNDVYVNAKKLAGILVEVEGQVGGDTYAIIGIGINLNLPNDIDDIDQPFIDLSEVSSQPIDRNALIASLVDNLHEMLIEFEVKGLSVFLKEWQQADLFFGKQVTLVSGTNEVNGISKGINDAGALLVDDGVQVSAHYGGEISVRERLC